MVAKKSTTRTRIITFSAVIGFICVGINIRIGGILPEEYVPRVLVMISIYLAFWMLREICSRFWDLDK